MADVELLEALLKHLEEAEAGMVRVLESIRWQPIETAPRDGTPVDLWTDYGRQTDCSFMQHDWREGRPIAPAAWFRRSADGPMPVPTHWMPIPPPPTDAGAE